MLIALYPGTFDPATNGHIDVAERASRIFSKVIAVIASNRMKQCLFSAEERFDMLKEVLKHMKNVEVIRYNGLIADCVRDYQASVIIRGLRALSDFDYEFQLAFTNRELNSNADTVFLMPSAQYIYLSSSLVRQLAQFGGDVSAFLPEYVQDCLLKKIGKK